MLLNYKLFLLFHVMNILHSVIFRQQLEFYLADKAGARLTEMSWALLSLAVVHSFESSRRARVLISTRSYILWTRYLSWELCLNSIIYDLPPRMTVALRKPVS